MTTHNSRAFRYVDQKIRVLRYWPWIDKETKKRHATHLDGFSDGSKGPSHEIVRLWHKNVKKPRQQTLQEMCDFINDRLLENPVLTLDLLSDETPLDTFLKCLGIEPWQIHDSEFSSWAHECNLCNSFTFESARDADAFGQAMSGRYHIVRRRLDERGKSKELLALVVYKNVPASQKTNERRVFIPCELTIQSRNTNDLFWYKGAVGPLGVGIEWRFFQEGSKNLDRIVVMSGMGNPRNVSSYDAMMLTMTEGPLFKPMASEVTIRRIGDIGSMEENMRFLQNTPNSRYSAKEISQANRELKRA